MKARFAIFLAVGLALFLFPRAVGAGDIPETPGVDKAAPSGDAVQPAEPPFSGTMAVPSLTPSPAADNAAPSGDAVQPAEPPFSGTMAVPSLTLPPAADNAAGIDNTWLDRYHRLFESGMFQSAVWLDNFIGAEPVQPHEKARMSLYWRNDFRYDQLQDFTYRSAFRVGFRLPHLAQRWNLIIAGENQGDPTAAIPVDPGNPGTDVRSQVRAVSTELVYDLFRTKRAFLDLGAGVHVKLSPDTFGRVKLGYEQPLGTYTLARFLATAYYNVPNGPGESNQLDLELRISPDTLMRWSNSATIYEGSSGWEWGTEIVLLHKLSPLSGVTVGGSARGPTRPAAVVQNYRVYTGYRRRVFRDWLFCELEPDVNWPLPGGGGQRETVWGATFRLEVQFVGTEQSLKIR